MKSLVVTLALTVAFASSAAAQTPTAGQVQAATDLMRAMNIERTMIGMAGATADMMIQQNAALMPYRDVLVKWAGAFMTWDVFGPRMARLYADSYTEAELRELAVFYTTPVGQKTLALLPELTRKGSALGGEVAAEHIPELQRLIQQRAEELAGAKP